MSLLRPAEARAYVNHGRWVADCPQGCGGAQELKPGQSMFACAVPECEVWSEIEWPPNPDEIWDVLENRPDPHNRNWFPKSHWLAVKSKQPHGQTPKELLDEQAEQEAYEMGGG